MHELHGAPRRKRDQRGSLVVKRNGRAPRSLADEARGVKRWLPQPLRNFLCKECRGKGATRHTALARYMRWWVTNTADRKPESVEEGSTKQVNSAPGVGRTRFAPGKRHAGGGSASWPPGYRSARYESGLWAQHRREFDEVVGGFGSDSREESSNSPMLGEGTRLFPTPLPFLRPRLQPRTASGQPR